MTTVISVDNVVVERDGRVVIADSSCTITKGTIVAIIGPNGSGKSTLLDVITGLLPISSGSISVLGDSPKNARSRTAYVLQHVTVTPGVPLSVKETVAMGRYSTTGLFRPLSRGDRERVAWAMAELRIDDLANRHVDKLSGGQRQRVFVAQALAQEHEILLLDEPLTGLDIPSAKVIDDVIHREPEAGCTVLFTTHDLEEARAADQVILISGRIVASGPPATVLTAENLAVAYGLGVLHPEHTHTEHTHPGPVLDAGHESETPPGLGP
jgi:iron complex transport system ATP-binding protein